MLTVTALITNIEERVLDTNDERDKADAFDSNFRYIMNPISRLSSL